MVHPPPFIRKLRTSVASWGALEYAYATVFWAMFALPLYKAGWGLWSFVIVPAALVVLLPVAWVLMRATAPFLPAAPALTHRRSHFIHFFTRTEGQERGGTLSFVAGKGSGTWTTKEGDSSGTLDIVLSEDDFRSLWNSARWMKELRQFEPASGDSARDAHTNYVVAILFTEHGQTYSSTYLIPHDCTSPKVVDWINAICLTHPIPAI
jgi:hypothetical protein